MALSPRYFTPTPGQPAVQGATTIPDFIIGATAGARLGGGHDDKAAAEPSSRHLA